MGEKKNKDHVSCFSIWRGGDGSEFFQENLFGGRSQEFSNSDEVTFGKCPGDLEKFPAMDLTHNDVTTVVDDVVVT